MKVQCYLDMRNKIKYAIIDESMMVETTDSVEEIIEIINNNYPYIEAIFEDSINFVGDEDVTDFLMMQLTYEIAEAILQDYAIIQVCDNEIGVMTEDELADIIFDSALFRKTISNG